MEGIDARFLEDLRRRAQAYLAPWGETAEFRELSPARKRAVRNASSELLSLIAKPSTAEQRNDRQTHDDGDSQASQTRPPRRSSVGDELRNMPPDAEAEVGVSLDYLAALMALDSIKGFGPAKFRLLHRAGASPVEVLRAPSLLDLGGSAAEGLREAIRTLPDDDRQRARQRAARQVVVALRNHARILTYDSPEYPRNLYESNNPVPILYARGNVDVLRERTAVACVGSRQIEAEYEHALTEFVSVACEAGWVVVSGFATGADTVGHRTAYEVHGRTVCVMPSGLDRPFPPENRALWDELVESSSAVMISEFPFGTSSSALTLQKRNKTIVGCALGVLISQSSAKGGAMNAFRFAVEQKKRVATFEPRADEPEAPEAPTSGNRAIGREQRVPSMVFGLRSASEEWLRWLSMLSSSI